MFAMKRNIMVFYCLKEFLKSLENLRRFVKGIGLDDVKDFGHALKSAHVLELGFKISQVREILCH